MNTDLTAPPITVEQILQLPKEIQTDIVAIYTLIYEKKFTGQVILNCHLGIPRTMQFPAPQIRVRDREPVT